MMKEKLNKMMSADESMFAILQMKDTCDYKFMRYSQIIKHNGFVSLDDYDVIYAAKLPDESFSDEEELLDYLFTVFNCSRPADFKGHSLSVSDIIVIKRHDMKSFHFIDSFGFKKIVGMESRGKEE